jgi:hypothetical protein
MTHEPRVVKIDGVERQRKGSNDRQYTAVQCGTGWHVDQRG